MALNISDWQQLSTSEMDEVIEFLKENCKIDLEIPASAGQHPPNSYQITNGLTSGGNVMKYGEEYRIYIDDMTGCPQFLAAEAKVATGYAARIGGNDAIKAIMTYGGLGVGRN